MANFNFDFPIVKVDDRQIVETMQRVLEESPWRVSHVNFTFRFGGTIHCRAEELAGHAQLNEVLDNRLDLITSFIYKSAEGRKIAVTRGAAKGESDVVAVHSGPADAPVEFAKVVAIVRRHFDTNSPAEAVASLVREDAGRMLEAREAALARLEATAAHLLTESEQARKRWEAEYKQKEKHLIQEFRERTDQLEAEYERRRTQLEAWEDQLSQREQESLSREGRHQLREQLRAKLADPEATFELGDQTRLLHRAVALLAGLLAALFAGATVYYVGEGLKAGGPAVFGATTVYQFASAALFVTTIVFLIRWYKQAFERGAAEELKARWHELELARQGWLLETAFAWRHEYGTEMPADLIAELTRRSMAVEAGARERSRSVTSDRSAVAVGRNGGDGSPR